MKIDILTLFPNLFAGFLTESIIKRAILNNLVEINIIDFRNFSPLNNKQVDDTPYGGGPGMVIRPEAIFNCLDEIKTNDSFVIMLSPSGVTFKQQMAKDLSLKKHLIFLCGRYEGFDERIKTLVDLELSLGDFVLTGGEVPAMAMVDAITRLIPGVINNESLKDESFNDNLLDYPVYTKPQIYRGLKVPDVLLSGNHKLIEEYRLEQRIKKTNELRPDLRKENN
ncbi:MAG: tRNA (guanosine(37)-N1)-methyltransferase TrmD [Firmicutes bacterium]|nr:tRNA (guanosine(37)-N1)-methyltransferase TrmD [Bacillota bacterium]